MKWLLVIFVFGSVPVFSQKKNIDFSEIDRSVQYVDAATPFLLSQQLTAACSTDLQKVRAIFRWITDNIAYRTYEPINRKKRSRIKEEEETDDTSLLKPLDERVAETVLANKVAVCDGYARLFKTLCNYAGLQAEVITGYGKTEPHKMHQRFRNNHSWNAVMIDSVWQLLDVTWASGYISWQNKFVRHIDEQYFLSPPEVFIREHYPDDIRWTLVEDPPLMAEFRFSPFKQRSFIKYNIVSYKPVTGIIEASLNDTIHIVLETSDVGKDRNISSDPFLDTTIYSTPSSALLVPQGMIGPKTTYTYIVNSPGVEWLYILYNDDIILRYKMVIKGQPPTMATSN